MATISSERFSYHIQIELAEIPICLHLQYEEAYRYFGSFCFNPAGADPNQCPNLFLTENDWSLLEKHGFTRCGQVEASFLASYCSDLLLQNSRCIIHAVAFRDAEKAWIITAEPGVGKSTQIRTLQELYPGVFSVICGDRPVLQLMDDGTVMVHPSPWNGKEFWSGSDSAPLSGIICLSRGETDAVTFVRKKNAVIPVYRALIHTARNEDIIRTAAAFTNDLLQSVPVWDFVNKDIPGSTQLLYQKVLREESE